jgi:hypothetical protein
MPRRIKITTRKKRIRQRGGSPGPNIYVFYHIYCNKHTEAVVKDQAFRIVFSGLYNRVNAIKCFLAGDQESINRIKTLLKNIGKKFEITKEGPGDTTYERFTLLDIPKHIKPDDKFLYIHSKGVSELGHFTKETPDYDKIFWWRTWMEYFLIKDFEKCLEALNSHDIVGVNYSTYHIGPHFSGNFWWTTGKYYLSLPKTIGPDYNDPEKYIFSGKGTHKDMDTSRVGADPSIDSGHLYKTAYHSSKYID